MKQLRQLSLLLRTLRRNGLREKVLAGGEEQERRLKCTHSSVHITACLTSYAEDEQIKIYCHLGRNLAHSRSPNFDSNVAFLPNIKHDSTQTRQQPTKWKVNAGRILRHSPNRHVLRVPKLIAPIFRSTLSLACVCVCAMRIWFAGVCLGGCFNMLSSSSISANNFRSILPQFSGTHTGSGSSSKMPKSPVSKNERQHSRIGVNSLQSKRK